MATLQAPPRIQDTLPHVFFHQAARLGGRVAMRRKEFGIWRRITWTEYAAQVKAVANALLASGVANGDRVGIIGENRPEWVISDLAIQSAGATTAGIYATSSPEQVHYILEHSDAALVVVEGEEQLDKLLGVRGRLPKLKQIIVMDPEGLRSFRDPMVMMFEDFVRLGERYAEQHPDALERRLATVTNDDVGVFIYTSGTTGPPKAAMLTHRNLLWALESERTVIPLTERDEMLSFLPLAHIAERSFSVNLPVYYGYTINFAENLESIPQNLQEVRPTVFFAVPRVWEKLHSTVILTMRDADWPKRVAFHLAVRLGQLYAHRKLSNRAMPVWLALAYGWAQLSALRPLRYRIGLDRVRVALSAAAPISPDILRFFWSLGVEIREIYAQTEGSAVGTIHPIGDVTLGTVGKPNPGVDVRLAPDGEILIRGPNVFKGYFKDPALTAQTVVDGWLHTGDVGEFDTVGNLRLTDRKKDIFINAYGKNIAPQYIENKLKFSPFINDAVIIGDGRKYLVALIVIDEDNVTKWAQDLRVPYTTFTDLSQSAQIRKLIAGEVATVNHTVSSPEQVKKFALLPKRLYQEDGEVTPTMKVKRKVIMEKFGPVIDGLYRD